MSDTTVIAQTSQKMAPISHIRRACVSILRLSTLRGPEEIRHQDLLNTLQMASSVRRLLRDYGRMGELEAMLSLFVRQLCQLEARGLAYLPGAIPLLDQP